METAVLVGIGLAIIWQGYILIKKHRRLNKKMKRMEDDRNIEFSGYIGSGVSQKKKNYPTLNDDHVHGAGIEPTKDKDHIA